MPALKGWEEVPVLLSERGVVPSETIERLVCVCGALLASPGAVMFFDQGIGGTVKLKVPELVNMAEAVLLELTKRGKEIHNA